jgi:carboxypeptidase Q
MKYISFFLVFLFHQSSFAQKEDSLFIRSIYDEVLTKSDCYENLRSLCKNVGNRLSGSENAEKAIRWGFDLLNSYDFDTVYLQEIIVPHWERGDKEELSVLIDNKKLDFQVLALGGSVATDGYLTAEVIEVHSFEELQALKKEEVTGKIVFYNTPMEPKNIRTGNSYGGCYTYRANGAVEAAKKGALATILRSLTLIHDNHPHTGVMNYQEDVVKIPAVAISTKEADLLSEYLLKDNKLKATLKTNCITHNDKKSYNVIGEIKGTQFKDKYLLVGGHLDSWDVGEGAHDDGAGVVQSIEVLRTLKALNYAPKHSLRVVLYMNEENGNRGGIHYAEMVKNKGEIHVAAIESDRGGFTPRGYSMEGTNQQFEKLVSWKKLLEPYDLHYFEKGFAGVDIGPLKNGKVALIGFVPDSQRYFDFHHAATDVFENVHKRELELGAASITAIIYLIDMYGI